MSDLIRPSIKDCPFCGECSNIDYVGTLEGEPFFEIRCCGCSASTGRSDLFDVIGMWNLRVCEDA